MLGYDAVTDVVASFVADPFLIRHDGAWYMFFEILEERRHKGSIGVAVSTDGVRWRYDGIVLRERGHLSFPYVFCWQGDYYMVPETLARRSVLLYRAARFPDRWKRVAVLFSGVGADPTPFEFDGRWWMFSCPTPKENDTLRLHVADTLLGPWREHPQSPVVAGDSRIARAAGRVIAWEGRLLRFAQDCHRYYGTAVRAFEITELTPERYRERPAREAPILAAGDQTWNAAGMHHVDAHVLPDGTWLAAVDGRAR